MNESKRVIIQVAAFACFVLGLMLFLFETRSTGEALETLKLTISWSVVSISGAALSVVAITVLVVLHFGDIKRLLKHR